MDILPNRLKLIRRLYQQGKSVPTIAHEMGISIWMIYKWMRRASIARRTPNESNRLSFLARPLSYHPKKKLSVAERTLKIAGLMLYWAEGAKRGGATIDLANSDPKMILLFIKFLRVIYRVSESKLRVLLYCYSNQIPTSLVKFWGKLTGIPLQQFTKPYVRRDYQPSQNGRMPYGLVHIRYSDQRLFQAIMEDINKLVEHLCWGSEVAKRS